MRGVLHRLPALYVTWPDMSVENTTFGWIDESAIGNYANLNTRVCLLHRSIYAADA